MIQGPLAEGECLTRCGNQYIVVTLDHKLVKLWLRFSPWQPEYFIVLPKSHVLREFERMPFGFEKRKLNATGKSRLPDPIQHPG